MRAPTIGRAKHVIERQRDGRVSRTPRAVHNEAAHSPGGVDILRADRRTAAATL
jgi:hypothetical protein